MKWMWSHSKIISSSFSKAIKFSILALGGLFFVVACSKVDFSQNKPPGCVNTNNQCQYDYEIYGTGGEVDILFVDDNSGSMSFEQVNMASHFPNFINQLDQRMLDYRIGVITTDIESSENPPRAINENGALQNGHLVYFQNGMPFLTPNTADKNNLFLQTMKRPETLSCDQFLKKSLDNKVDRNSTQFQKDYYDLCPSGDERGILAASLLLQSNESQFIRPQAHLALVFLTDENNRSFGNTDAGMPYALETQDMPQTIVDMVKQKYTSSGKSFRVHSVVVPSQDTSCLNIQNNQLSGIIKGQYGTIYEQLSDLTKGYKGSVCASDWGAQMGEIGAAIVRQVKTIKLHCASPENLKVTFIPESAQNTYVMSGEYMTFARPLDPSARVHFSYKCP